MNQTTETQPLPSQHEVNIFLDILRSSGVTNMFGAAPYITEHFGVEKRKAQEFLMVWMRTFGERRAAGEVID